MAYEFPDDLRYTREDEWARADGNRVVVGVTDYAQQQLGDIVFVELPEVGSEVKAGASFGVIESVKAVSDLYAPLDGRVVEVNEALADAPERVNEGCYGEGWMLALEVADAGALDGLMTAADYARYVDERSD